MLALSQFGRCPVQILISWNVWLPDKLELEVDFNGRYPVKRLCNGFGASNVWYHEETTPFL